MRKGQTFFGDDCRLRVLNLQKRLDATLELSVEHLLLVGPPIFLGQIDSRNGHAEDDKHHRQEQLCPEAERSRKTVF